MSASKEKKTREEQRSSGSDKKRNAANEDVLKAQKFRRNAIIAVVCIVLVVAAAIVINSNLFYTSLTAVKVGNTSYSAAEVDVFYRNTYNSIYNSWGDFASYIIDTSTPLDEQQYSDDQTWADYILEQTQTNMRQITALYDAANAAGYTVTADDEALISEQIASMEYSAAAGGWSNLNQFLAAYYGKGVNSKVLESVLTKMIVAQNYAAQVSDSLSYTSEELDAYYSEHKDELDFINFYYYLVSTGNEAFDTLESDEAKQSAAHDAAEAIVSDTGSASDFVDAFTDAVAGFSEDAAPTEQYAQSSGISGDYSDWLLDSARQPGDTTVVDTDDGAYAVLFVARDDNDYFSKSMRHILIETEPDENNEYTDEAKDAAQARIEEIETEWKLDPTEDHFAELANQYSEDSGSNTTGGLYENIRRRQMVTNINDFLFNASRKAGDTGVVYGESGAYQGWHLVYFVGDGPLCKHYLAENALRSEDYSDYIEGLEANYEVTTGSGLRYVKVK